MSQGQEQEQLFQDALTLLMFASTAARQQPPAEPAPATLAGAPPGTSTSGDLQRLLANDGQAKLENIGSTGTNTPVNMSRRPLQPVLPAVASPPSYAGAGYPGATSPPTILPPHRANQSVLPQLKPFPIASHPVGSIDARMLPHGYNYPPQMLPNLRPLYPAEPSQHAQGIPASAGNLAVNRGSPSYGLAPALAAAPGAVPGPYSQYYTGNFRQNLGLANVPLRRKSIAQPPSGGEAGAQKQHFRKTQSASPQEGAPKPKLVPLSPKPAQTDRSPLNPDLPARGNFSVGHKRTVSETIPRRPSNASKPGSPSVSGIPFARGINVESGKRSTDNAVIAAAALAAAAEVPFPPLKSKEQSEKAQALGAPLEPSVAIVAPASEAMSAPKTPVTPRHANVEVPAGKGPGLSLKIEDSALTEPEDENQTEDEPVSSARGSFSAIEAPQNLHFGPNLAQNPAASAPESVPEPAIPDVPPARIEGKKRGAKSPKPPPLQSYKVGPDAGIIGCICGIEEDDGFTIQCDLCFRWQHCSCMGYLTNEEVPEDEYKCYYCDELKWNKIDAAACRKATIARLDMDKYNDSPGPEKDEKPPTPKRKTLGSGHDDRHEKHDKHEKKRRKSDKDVKPPLERVPSDKRKSLGGGSPTSKPASAPEISNKENPLLEDGATAELYQGLYYRLEENDYKTPAVRNLVQTLGVTAEKAAKASLAFETMSLAQFKQLKFSKICLPSHQKYLQERNELRRGKGSNKTIVQVKAYSENPKQKFVSVLKVGLFITEKASAGSDSVIPAGTVVIEYLGEVDLWLLHVANKINQYSLWGTVKPKVAKVRVASTNSADVDLVLDSRFVGNEARFIRRSCATSANCEIRPVYIPQLHTFKFLVVTTQPIALGRDKDEEELRLPWEWDVQHPITQMIQHTPEGTFEEGKRFEDFSEQEKGYLISCVDTILSYVECACNTSAINNQCAIFKVKKATSYLLRSNRKASSLGGGFSKSKEELVMPKKPKEYVSWKQRLVDRDSLLLEQSKLAPEHLEMGPEPSAESEAPPEAETSIAVDTKDSGSDTKRCWVTFRQKLLAQTRGFNRNFTVANCKVSSGTDEVVEATAVVDEVPRNALAVPLTSEVLARIQSQVNDAFMPLQKSVSMHDLKVEATEVKVDAPVQEVAEIKEALPKPVQAPPVVEVAVPEVKPPVVKKLSFADYKKKMK